MLIGLTGGIASGKSTVSTLLIEHGAFLVDADQVARDVVEAGQPALLQIVEKFGHQVLLPNGQLNRKYLGDIVFSDADKLVQLEAITHPAIRKAMLERIDQIKQTSPHSLIVADVPLLYESKQEHLYKGIVVVYVPETIQRQRLMVRNGLSEAEANSRISLQMDIEEKRKRADWVIDNSGSIDHTKLQVRQLVERLGFL